MSAYIEPHAHIATLARWAVEHDIKNIWCPTRIEKILDVSQVSDEVRYRTFANILEKQNVLSVDARYDDLHYQRVFQNMSEGRAHIDDDDIAMACKGYKYQACETDDWTKTDAFWLIYAIEQKLLDRMSTESPCWSIND